MKVAATIGKINEQLYSQKLNTMPRLVMLGEILNIHSFIQVFSQNIHIHESLNMNEYSIVGTLGTVHHMLFSSQNRVYQRRMK